MKNVRGVLKDIEEKNRLQVHKSRHTMKAITPHSGELVMFKHRKCTFQNSFVAYHDSSRQKSVILVLKLK